MENKTDSKLEDAKDTAERIEAGNKELKELLDRQESMRVQATLDGKSEASIPEKVLTEDEKWAADAKIRYAGTGMDPTE